MCGNAALGQFNRKKFPEKKLLFVKISKNVFNLSICKCNDNRLYSKKVLRNINPHAALSEWEFKIEVSAEYGRLGPLQKKKATCWCCLLFKMFLSCFFFKVILLENQFKPKAYLGCYLREQNVLVKLSNGFC